MALTGLEIYKLLPKTNCKDCGFPTCLAFAMKLSQKATELDKCPSVSDEAKTALDAALGELAPRLGHVRGGTALLLAPRLLADRADHRQLRHGVAHEGGEAQALHHRVRVFEAVAQGAGGRVHQHALERQTHVADQDVELLG